MRKNIPTYNIQQIAGAAAGEVEVFFTEHQINQPNLVINIPYRSNYYGVGICLGGSASLRANLETYKIREHALITMSPTVIKQWLHRSVDFETLTVFFTKEFLLATSSGKHPLHQLPFFDPYGQHVVSLTKNQARKLQTWLKQIQLQLNTPGVFQQDIVRHLLSILLLDVTATASQVSARPPAKLTRSQILTQDFKKLVCTHFSRERGVTFYAQQLFVTPKHLTETVKQETGKAAKAWIDELVILEAKVRLQDSSNTIAEIADSLSFPDPSVFGKFFKNLTGLSPLAYRQSL